MAHMTLTDEEQDAIVLDVLIKLGKEAGAIPADYEPELDWPPRLGRSAEDEDVDIGRWEGDGGATAPGPAKGGR